MSPLVAAQTQDTVIVQAERQERKEKVKVAQSCLTLCDPMDWPWNSLGQNTGMGSLSLLQGIFPTQGSNPGLLHCRQILHQLSHQWAAEIQYGSPLLAAQRGRDFQRNEGVSSWT